MRAQEEQQGRTPAAKNREAGASATRSQDAYRAARMPGTPAAATALQRSVGNQAYVVARTEAAPEAHTHSAGCGHGGMHSQTGELAGPEEQIQALKAADAAPAQRLSGAELKEEQTYFQNPAISEVTISTGPAVQDALNAFGARSMTVGKKIFLGDARDKKHELSHANEAVLGMEVTGKDAGAGIPVTEKNQASEVRAEGDAAASASGSAIAPSVLQRMTTTQRATALQNVEREE